MRKDQADVVTTTGPDAGRYWRYLDASKPAFNPQVFDERYLEEHDLLDGEAAAGRGNTFFFNLDNHALVLRHYRRGGLARHVSARRYVYTGLSRTRALTEFDVLLRLQALNLPAPIPYAVQVLMGRCTYEASLITHRIAGDTLARQLSRQAVSTALWRSIGARLAQFHRNGVFHADLNAHNIMIDDTDQVSLIDFDRGAIRALPANPSGSGWCEANIRRLERSLRKIAVQRRSVLADTQHDPNGDLNRNLNEDWESGFTQLRAEWSEVLSAPLS